MAEAGPGEARDAGVVQQAMLDILFPLTPHDQIWQEYRDFEPVRQPESIWQFSRRRYVWAKDQWPNLSDRITTIWTLQDFGLIPHDVDVETVMTVADGKAQVQVKIPPRPSAAPPPAPSPDEESDADAS